MDPKATAYLPKPCSGTVWFAGAMGLLDDAIREHLELKRLGGADPGEVAREEQDALGTIRRDGEAAQGAEESPPVETQLDTGRSFPLDAEPTSVVDSPPSQETVEINMEAELSGKSDSKLGASPQSGHASPVAHQAHAQVNTEDSLEWEVPSESNREPSGSGEVVDPNLDADSESAEHVEDVLEETPDFLRDTPEQERLWFEQRPPRDFDFNE
jgi:hypothetical protein